MSRGHNLNNCYIVPSMDLVVVRQGNENYTGEEQSLFMMMIIQKIVASIPTKN
jgi:hypothetical protein